MRFLSKLWLYCLFLLSASAVSNGNIPACSVDMSIGVGTAIMKWVRAPVSSSMYTITAPATTYVPGELTPITVTVTDLDYVYIGMLLVAVLNNGTNVGKWSVMDGDDFFLPSTCKFQAVVHASAELKPINQTFFWKSDANVGPVKFRALIKQGEQAHGNFYKPADLTLTPSSAVPTTQTVFKGDVGESCNEVCGQKGMACDDTGTLGLNTPAILQTQVSKFYPCQEPYLKACAPPGTGANSYCFSYNCLASQTFNLASTCSYRSADPLMNQRFCKCKAGTVVRDPTKPASDASSTIGMHLDDPVQMDELTLNSLEITSTDVTVDVTGPQDRWFAIGWDAAYMSGTYATVVWLNNASVGIPQNYDLIADKGYADGVTGWYDINCRQALVDFCRNVGPNTNKYFSCAMANTTAGTTMRDVYLANTSSRVPCKNSHIAPFLPMTVAEYVLSDSPRNGTKLPSSITIKSSGVVGGRFNIVFSRPLTGARAFPNKASMNLIWAIGVTQYFGVSNGAFNKHSKKSESVVPISLTPIYATCPPSPPTAPTTKRPTSPTTKTPTAATPTAAPPTTAPTTPPTTKAPTAPTSPTGPTAPTAKPTTKAPATKAPTARAPTAPTAKPTTKVPTAPTAPTAPTMPTSVPTGSPTVFVPPTPEEMLSPAFNRLPSLWVLPALAAMGSKNWLCGALLAVLLRPVSAHNWMNSPSRAQMAAVSIPCQKRVDPAPHLQVIPGQKFQLEWSTGHGDTTTVYTYFVFVKEEDYDKLALLQDPMMDEYLSKAPAASLLTGDQWTKRHLSPWSAYYTGCTDCNNGNNNPGTFASVINPGTPRYIARNNIAVQKSLKKGDANVTQFWYNLGDLAGDMRAEYKSEKYPWMLSVHRFRIAAHWPSEYDMATFAFPTNLTAGNYIAHFKWGGYRDCTDVHIILNLNPVAALWGSLGNVTGSFTRLDHCEFTFVLNPLVGCQKITAGNASQCIATCLTTENCVAVQAVRKTNPAGTMPYTPNFPYKNYTRNDSAINVFPPPEYGPCDSRTIHKRRNCPAITPKCNDAALNPIAADEYLCYGINPYRDQDFQTVDDYVISTDPQDPGFYSTCWVRLAPGGFTYPYPQPATPPPVWKVGKKCLSCDWLKNTYAGLSDKTAPDWTQAFSTDCRDCDISATQCATDLKPEISFGNAGNCTGTLSSNQVCNAQCDSGFTLFGAPRVCQNGLLTGGNQECVFGGCP